jgi:hypothetical protein
MRALAAILGTALTLRVTGFVVLPCGERSIVKGFYLDSI